MATFLDHLKNSKKQYNFTIKIATSDSDIIENMKSGIEHSVEKYDLVELTPFRKTVLQENPLDFPNLKNVEVHIANVTLDYPVTPDALIRNISNSLGIKETCVAVYTSNDPIHGYEEQYLERNSKEFGEKYETKLGTDYEDSEDVVYGQDQIDETMNAHEEERKDRRVDVVTNPLMPDREFDDVTITGDEKSPQNNDSVLKDRYSDAEKTSPNKGKNTMFGAK